MPPTKEMEVEVEDRLPSKLSGICYEAVSTPGQTFLTRYLRRRED